MNYEEMTQNEIINDHKELLIKLEQEKSVVEGLKKDLADQNKEIDNIHEALDVIETPRFIDVIEYSYCGSEPTKKKLSLSSRIIYFVDMIRTQYTLNKQK